MSRPLLLTLAAATLLAPTANAQSPPAEPTTKVVRAKAAVPDGMARLSDTLTGSYFVAYPLKLKYDALLAKLDALKRDLDADRVAGPEAVKSLGELRANLKELRDQLDKSKVMIPAVQAHAKTETVSLDIGPDRTLVITAERVRLVGTDGDKVVCTLEKIYLGGDAKEAEAELAAVTVVHKHGLQPDLFGWTPEQWDADLAKFLKTPEGQKTPPEVLAKWRRESAPSRALSERYREFRGKSVDTIRVGGVDSSQADSIVEITSTSKGGDGITRQVRRRHATLTVAVPKCQRVAVEGARVALEVVGLRGSLLVTDNGNRDRDYDGQFTIKGVTGDVDATGYPFSAIEDVTGGVTLTSMRDSGASGGSRYSYEGDTRALVRSRPASCAIKNVGGDLKARFGRVDVNVEDVRGAVAVDNDAGDTKLTVKTPLALTAAHRLTSVSGTIDVSFSPGALGRLPLAAGTTYGTYLAKIPNLAFPGFVSQDISGVNNNCEGFYHQLTKAPDEGSAAMQSVLGALRPEDKSPGLLIRTLAGRMVVTFADK